MKRIISIILLLSLVGGTYAQKDTTGKRKVRPIVDLNVGTECVIGEWDFVPVIEAFVKTFLNLVLPTGIYYSSFYKEKAYYN